MISKNGPSKNGPKYTQPLQGAKKVIFTACHSGKLKLTFTSPNIISTSPKNVLMSRLISQFFCNLNSAKDFNCPSSKLITEFTSPIAKSTSPWLSDTTFFARCPSNMLPCFDGLISRSNAQTSQEKDVPVFT